ncbi:hypothetical protein HAX54_000977 [Datura stramonium]|uniref:Retrotransposon gag domain-containing protein n=1 Tax=Datura stramonium TaxID=4076 RepID=A0ABS8WUY7_DATST|nr:hypothetical protein [Datura stramonium]
MAALPPREIDNVFAEMNNDIDYTSTIVPPRVNAPTLKIDRSICTMLKAKSQFYNFTYQDPHQHLKNSWRQLPGEKLFEAWERFKQYVIISPTHGFSKNILLEKFYIDLDPLTQLVENNMAGGCFMDKTYDYITITLETITKHN